MKARLLLSLIFLFTISYPITAIDRYICDFEDLVENANWDLNLILNPNIHYANKWFIGNAIHNGGTHSLYISADGGNSAIYRTSSRMIAARHLQLDAGDYELSFDWLGGMIGTEDQLYVSWVSESTDTYCTPNAVMPDFDTMTPDNSTTVAMSSAWWKSSVFHFTSDGSPHKLVFTWVNNTNNSMVKSGAIDNINIIPRGLCDAPEDLQTTVSGSTVTLQWSGNASTYDVKYYSFEEDRWEYRNSISGNNTVINNLTEGLHNFYVRSVCENENSRWVSLEELIYFPEYRCIDYLSLTNLNCWIGETSNNGRGRRELVNKGFDNPESRHTVHYVKNEYDSNSGGMLPTIPKDEIASVRLGNWLTGNEAESIDYSFKVDAETMSILLLKYAVVLEDPSHKVEEQPLFELKVLRQNGQSLDVNKCGEANFRAGYDTTDPSWHFVDGTWWKEWTTIGINLEEYDGETLRIQITSYDCTLGGHFGYAYFTLGCTTGEINGITCGDTPTTQFIAPEGFNYRWYLPDNPQTILGTEQVYDVLPNDTLTYFCDMIFPTNPLCFFTLSASGIPRYPVIDVSYTTSTENCINTVSFINNSYIMNVNQVTNDSTHLHNIPCESVSWNFDDSSPVSGIYSPEHVFPIEGGTFKVHLTVGISNNMCTEDTIITLSLPDLRTTYDTIPAYGCLGQPWIMPKSGEIKWSDGLYEYIDSSIYGCDSIIVYDLKFSEKIEVDIYETRCSYEAPYEFDGELLTESGTHVSVYPSMYGCDSITTLYLTVIETVEAEISKIPEVCSGEPEIELEFITLSGNITLYEILFNEDTKQKLGLEDLNGIAYSPLLIPLPPDALPGYYGGEMIFYDEACGNDTLQLHFSINYPSSIISQRWSDILFLKNSEHNGGYEFSSYQWYKGDIKIEGETGSYLQVSEGLDTEALYRVELTRSDDNITAFTCPFRPELIENASLTLVSNTSTDGESFQLNSSAKGKASIYNISGLLLKEQNIVEGSNQIKSPEASGYYILQVKLENQQSKVYHINVVR